MEQKLEYKEPMKFIVYKSKKTSKKELPKHERYLAHQRIPNSKMQMYFFKAEKEMPNEEGEAELVKGNIQVYLDEKRDFVFAEKTSLSDTTHELLFEGYEVYGELEIPGKKEANEKFVRKMLMHIRAYK